MWNIMDWNWAWNGHFSTNETWPRAYLTLRTTIIRAIMIIALLANCLQQFGGYCTSSIFLRQVLRLTQKVRREYEPPKSAQLNFEATFCGIFSLWLPCWAQIWIVQHKNSVFLMRNRIHTQNSQRNHLLSLILSSGTLFDKWISHIRRMDLSFAGVLFLYNSTLQLVRLTWNDHTSENAVF